MPGSKLLISRNKEIYEHALASATCLLSGLEVFNAEYSHQDRISRVLKGMHGFYIYANQYWVDYVLEIFSSSSQQQVCDLTATLRTLSNALEMFGGLSLHSKKTGESAVSENRLDLIKEYLGLYQNAKIVLQARKQKIVVGVSSKEGYIFFPIANIYQPITQVYLQRTLESPCVDLSPIRELGDVLANYQKTIRSLLSQSELPGIAKEDLERFQREYCTTVFTCHLPSCPRATSGFESERLQLQHEATHTLHLKCHFPGCQYPPFVSVRALKSHELKCHSTQGRKNIRKVGSMEEMNLGLNANYGKHQSDPGSEKRNGMIEEGMGDITNLTQQPQLEAQMKQRQSSQVQRQIAVLLQSQGPFTGWRAEVTIPERARKILQMYFSSCYLSFV